MKIPAILVLVLLLVSAFANVLVPEVQAAPSLSNGYVTPVSGDVTTVFHYYVTYYDSMGMAPDTRHVVIDGNVWTMTLWNGIQIGRAHV
jgi:hypothetical protein